MLAPTTTSHLAESASAYDGQRLEVIRCHALALQPNVVALPLLQLIQHALLLLFADASLLLQLSLQSSTPAMAA